MSTDLLAKAAAAGVVEHHVAGLLARRKAKRRGFYVDPSPGIFGLRAAFDREARNAGKLAALRSFGLLHGKEDPVEALTELYRTDDFGLPRREAREDTVGRDKTRRPYTGC